MIILDKYWSLEYLSYWENIVLWFIGKLKRIYRYSLEFREFDWNKGSY